MPAGPINLFDKAILNMFNATALLNPANTFNVSLHTSAMTPDLAADEVFADMDAQIAAGNGYTAGGKALTGVAVSQVGGIFKFTHAPVVWTAAGGSIPAWRFGLIRVVGVINGKTDPVVGYFLGDAEPKDIPATTVGNTLTISANAAGAITAARA